MKRSKAGYDLFLLIIAVIASLVIIKGGLDRYDSLKAQEARLLKEKVAGEARKKYLSARIRQLETDGYVEMAARRRLGYIKNGELAYKVIRKE